MGKHYDTQKKLTLHHAPVSVHIHTHSNRKFLCYAKYWGAHKCPVQSILMPFFGFAWEIFQTHICPTRSNRSENLINFFFRLKSDFNEARRLCGHQKLNAKMRFYTHLLLGIKGKIWDRFWLLLLFLMCKVRWFFVYKGFKIEQRIEEITVTLLIFLGKFTVCVRY